MTRKFVGLSMRPEVLVALDNARGEVPRSRYVERAIREQLGISPPVRLAGNAGEE